MAALQPKASSNNCLRGPERHKMARGAIPTGAAVGLVSSTDPNRVVNPAGVVRPRVGEFLGESAGADPNLQGLHRCPIRASRNGERGPGRRIDANRCGKGPKRKNAGTTLSRRSALTGVGAGSATDWKAPRKQPLSKQLSVLGC